MKEMPIALLSCDEAFDAFLAHEAASVARGDLAHSALESHRQTLNHTWRPALSGRPFLSVRCSQLQHIADAKAWTKKTYNDAINALRRTFAFGFKDHPDARDPAAMMRGARIGKKDRAHLDPSVFRTPKPSSLPCAVIGVPRKRTTMPFASSPDCVRRNRSRSS